MRGGMSEGGIPAGSQRSKINPSVLGCRKENGVNVASEKMHLSVHFVHLSVHFKDGCAKVFSLCG